MFCTVYRCRFQGEKLDAAAIRESGVAGDLRVRRRGMGRIALLLAPDGETYLAPVLTRVRLLEVEPRGLLLTGVEAYPGRSDKRDGPRFVQTWWCMPCRRPLDRRGAELVQHAQDRRTAHEVGRTMSAHSGRRPW